MRKPCILKFIMLIFPFALACGTTSLFDTFKPEKLDFPKAVYSEIGWLNQELIAFVNDMESSLELNYAKQGSFDFDILRFENDPNCLYSTQYTLVSIYNNEYIQVRKQCFTEPHSTNTVIVYSWDSKSIERTIEELPLGTGKIYWNPNTTHGLAVFADAFAKETLYLIKQDGYSALNIDISDEGKSWNFNDFFPDFPDIEATTGNIGRADWSPDGKFVVFFASPDSVGKVGFDRMYAQYKMYIMEFDNPNPTPLLDEILFPANIKWSPDAKYIAFVGQYQDSSEAIWLYSFDDSSIIMIDEGDFRDILWSPDSNSLIAIKCNGLFECMDTDIVKYDISGIANK